MWQYDDAWRYAKSYLLNFYLRFKNEHKPLCMAIKTANNLNIGLRFHIVSFLWNLKFKIDLYKVYNHMCAQYTVQALSNLISKETFFGS